MHGCNCVRAFDGNTPRWLVEILENLVLSQVRIAVQYFMPWNIYALMVGDHSKRVLLISQLNKASSEHLVPSHGL